MSPLGDHALSCSEMPRTRAIEQQLADGGDAEDGATTRACAGWNWRAMDIVE